MAGSGRRYAPEFKARMVELVRAGRSPDRLAKEFEPSATAIRRWVEQADRDEGLSRDGLTTAERKEVRELKRELRRVKLERDVLAKPRLGSQGRADQSPEGVPVRERPLGHLSGAHDVPSAGSLPERVLCVAQARAVMAGERECGPDRGDPGDSCAQRWDVRGSPDPCGAAGEGTGGEPQPGGAADAGGGDRGREPTPEGDDDATRAGSGGCRGPGGPGLLGRGSRRALGGRYHVRSHAGRRLSISGGGAGRVEPASGGLVDGGAPEDLTGAGCVGHGAHAAAARRRDQPLG